MSWLHVFRWTCDICGKDAEKQGYGFLKGWTYYFHRNGVWSTVEHACSGCREQFKIKQVDDKGKVEATQLSSEQIEGYKALAGGSHD